MPEISKQIFSNHIGSIFKIHLGENQIYSLELIRFQEFNLNPKIEQFSVLFQGSAETLLPQSTYLLENEEFGSFAIFIVPVGTSSDRAFYHYEAVFNRFIKEASE